MQHICVVEQRAKLGCALLLGEPSRCAGASEVLGATLPVLMAPMMLLMEGAPPDGCWVVSVSASSIPARTHAKASALVPIIVLACSMQNGRACTVGLPA